MKVFLIICMLLSSLFLMPSPTIARELSHNGEVGDHKPLATGPGKTGGTNNPGYGIGCGSGGKGLPCKCPRYKPHCRGSSP